MNVWAVDYDPHLSHYWPIDKHTKDLLNGHDMSSANPILVDDRFRSRLSAVRINDNISTYYRITPSVRFNGPYSILAWVRPLSCGKFARVFDCGNDHSSNVVLAYSLDNNCKVVGNVRNIDGTTKSVPSEFKIPANMSMWSHLAVTFTPNSFTQVFVNGEFDANISVFYPTDVPRADCYVGYSKVINVSPTEAEIDEIKIYNRTLTAQEILQDMFLNRSLITEV